MIYVYPPSSINPNITPVKVGQMWVNTVTGRVFISVGTSSSADWVDVAESSASISLSAGDLLIGRVSSGAGVSEEIPCTSAGRNILAGASAAAQRTTLGLGTAATVNVPASGNAASGESVKGSDTRLTDARVPSAHTHPSVDISDSTAAGRAIVTGASPAAQRTSLGLGTAATVNVPASGDAASGESVKGDDTRLTDSRAPTAHSQASSTISDSTAAGRAVLTAADATAQRSSLGLGSLATQSGTFSGTSSGVNTGDQTIPTLTEVEIDFGAAAVRDKAFTIADARVSAASKIIAMESGKIATGRQIGDSLWDSLSVTALPGTAQFTLFAEANPGPVEGKRIIQYLIN